MRAAANVTGPRARRATRGAQGRALALAQLVALLGACDEPVAAPPTQEAALDEGAVVARVGEALIHSEQVRRHATTHGVSPREALRALEDEALLLAEARRRGWRGSSAAATVREDEQLLAQRVLLDVERAVPLESPNHEDVAAYLAAHEDEIVREEQRDCVQVLLQLPEDGQVSAEQAQLASEYAERVLARMRVEGVEAVWASQPPHYQGLRVLSHYLPPATLSTPMPDAFRAVVFALDSPGPVATVVRTANGWHAIGVTAIHPPIEAGSARALTLARERLVTLRRREALDALLERLRERFRVSISSANVDAVVPALGRPEGPAT